MKSTFPASILAVHSSPVHSEQRKWEHSIDTGFVHRRSLVCGTNDVHHDNAGMAIWGISFLWPSFVLARIVN